MAECESGGGVVCWEGGAGKSIRRWARPKSGCRAELSVAVFEEPGYALCLFECRRVESANVMAELGAESFNKHRKKLMVRPVRCSARELCEVGGELLHRARLLEVR